MYADDVRLTDNMLSAARVAVYPVDARGLMTLPSANAANSFPSGGSWGGSSGRSSGGSSPGKGGGAGKGGGGRGPGGVGSGAGGIHQPAAAVADQKFLTQHASMQQIAEETGGEAFVDTNGLKDAVARAITDGSHYYTVGYVPALKEYDGAFRHIRVDVEGGYQAAYRHGYYADDPTKAAVNPQASQNPMNGAVVRGAPPLAEILFKVRVLSADDPKAKGVKLISEPAGQRAKVRKQPRCALDIQTSRRPPFPSEWLVLPKAPQGSYPWFRAAGRW